MGDLHIITSGLKVAQAGLKTVETNMGNKLNSNYSNQEMTISTTGPGLNSGINPGNGAKIEGIYRRVNESHIKQESQTSSEYHYSETMSDSLTSLEKSVTVNLKNRLQLKLNDFVVQLSEAELHSTDKTTRLSVIEKAKGLASTFNDFNQQINQQKENLAEKSKSVVNDINQLCAQIAQANQKIIEYQSNGTTNNSLCDQRDATVRELSTLLEMDLHRDAKGQYNISLKDGKQLVDGNMARKLELTPLPQGGQTVKLHYSHTSDAINPACGGQLGAINDLAFETLSDLQKNIQTIAQTLADKFNQQLQAGYDLNGNKGEPLFKFFNNDPQGKILQVEQITPDQLAFSADATLPNDNGNIKELENCLILNKEVRINTMSEMTIRETLDAVINQFTMGVAGHQEVTKLAKMNLEEIYQIRTSLSGVDENEQYAKFMEFTQHYQSMMELISSYKKIFDSLLAAIR
ncbi:flagellar hook-associated protein FlgK [Candidatus Regiella insecticola]|nr:flagellar hook-associated protein FlgK [Candidatus Regiella insecticola]